MSKGVHCESENLITCIMLTISVYMFELSRDIGHAHYDPWNKLSVYVMSMSLCSSHVVCCRQRMGSDTAR